MKVVDMFCGMGGLSLGFKQAGFDVVGYDKNPHALATYRQNVGTAFEIDLGASIPPETPDCVVGGPPCRPWSPINLHRRNAMHDDYDLVRTFDRYVLSCLPAAFVLENVPLLQYDRNFEQLLQALEPEYAFQRRVVTYSDWGVASRRRRLFVIGLLRSRGQATSEVLAAVDASRIPAATVRQAIGKYAQWPSRPELDHEWSNLKTIDKYADKYASGQYGWYRLQWDAPAPSFGNVAKTYTLHPGDSNGSVPRVLSPREVMALLGFEESFVFPASVPRTAKYRMVADAVSPRFGLVLARAIRGALSNGR